MAALEDGDVVGESRVEPCVEAVEEVAVIGQKVGVGAGQRIFNRGRCPLDAAEAVGFPDSPEAEEGQIHSRGKDRLDNRRLGHVEMVGKSRSAGSPGSGNHLEGCVAGVPEQDALVVVFEPVAEEPGPHAEEFPDQAGERPVGIPLHCGGEIFGDQPHQGEIGPLARDIGQLGPAAQRGGIEGLLGGQITQRKVKAALDLEVFPGHPHTRQPERADVFHIGGNTLRIERMDPVHEFVETRVVQLRAEDPVEHKRVNLHIEKPGCMAADEAEVPVTTRSLEKYVGRDLVKDDRAQKADIIPLLPQSCPPFYLRDEHNKIIDPTLEEDVNRPVNFRQTCGGPACHDVPRITEGYHFQMGADELYFPSELGEHIPVDKGPGYYGNWRLFEQRELSPLHFDDPNYVDETPFDWLQDGGVFHPGGGPAEYDRVGRRYDVVQAQDPNVSIYYNGDYYGAEWHKTGVAGPDCLICHLETYDYSLRAEQLKKGAKSLVGNKGYRRYIKGKSEVFEIDFAKIEAEARFDGKWVLQTNTDLQTDEVALKYKQLWMVEAMFRSMKSLLETRPIYHRLDETIRGHVFCSFLALVVRKELEDRLAARGEKLEWADVLRDLEALTEVEVEQNGKRYALRSEARGTCGRVFRAVGVAFPPTVRRLAKRME